MKTVHFIRHGETEQNAQKVWQGHTDTPLNKKGLEQAKLLSERISDRVTKVYSSDLKRASQTASFLSSSPVLRDNLREINVGNFTGMSVKDTYTSNHGISLNCLLTSSIILKAALPTALIVMAANKNGNIPPKNSPAVTST